MSKNITNSSSVTSPNFLFDSQMKKEDSETISSLDEGQTLTTIPIKIDEKDHSDKNENDVVSISHDLHPFETESSLTTVEKSKSQLSRNQSLDFYYGKSLLKRNSSVLGNLASLYINQQVNGADSSTSSVFNELDYTVSVINEEFWQTIHTIWYFPKIENKNNSINEICTTAEKNTETIVDHYCSNGEKVSDSINVLDCFFGLVNQWIVYKHPQSIYEKCSLFFNRIFKNSNMTSKLEEQLQDSIAAFTKFLPEWIYKLPIQNPYLFSFNSRQHLFNVMTFDHRRMLKKLKVPNISSPRTSRTYAVTKRKLIVRRQQLLESSSSFFNDISENLLEVSFENEEGTGLGPTVEFYSLLSMQFRLKALKMWRTSSYLTSQQDALTDLFVPIMGSGLFPDVLSSTDFDFNAPQSVDISKNSQPTNLRQLFVYFGRFLARSIKDDKPTDLTLSYSFFKWLVDGGKSVCSMAYLLDVDPVLYNSLTNLLLISNQSETKNKQNKDCQSFMDSSDCSIESMQLNFVLPSCYNNIELVKNGSNIPVNSSNVHEYVEAVVNYVMYEGVKNKFEAIIEGIQSILSEGPTWLRLFLPHEMMNMFGMNDAFTPWQYKDLIESIKPNHGYSYDHPTFINFIRMLTEFNLMEQRQFLRFVTGSPRLPFGGFPGLEPPIVVVRSYEVNSKIPVTSRDVSKEDNNKDLPNHVLDGSSHYLTEEDYHSFVDTDACNWSTSKENVSIKLLPSVMTCAHYLKMPNYQTVEEMKQRFKIALEEGSESFHLS